MGNAAGHLRFRLHAFVLEQIALVLPEFQVGGLQIGREESLREQFSQVSLARENSLAQVLAQANQIRLHTGAMWLAVRVDGGVGGWSAKQCQASILFATCRPDHIGVAEPLIIALGAGWPVSFSGSKETFAPNGPKAHK